MSILQVAVVNVKNIMLELFWWMPLLSWILLNQIYEYLILLNVSTKPIATFRVQFNCLWLTPKRSFLLKQLFLENSAIEHGALELLCIMLGQFLFAFRWYDQLTFQHKDPSEQYREFDVTVSLSQALNLKKYSLCMHNICTASHVIKEFLWLVSTCSCLFFCPHFYFDWCILKWSHFPYTRHPLCLHFAGDTSCVAISASPPLVFQLDWFSCQQCQLRQCCKCRRASSSLLLRGW